MTRPKSLAPVVLMLAEFFLALAVANAQTARGAFQAWVVSTGMRLTPASIGSTSGAEASAQAFRNEIVSMQFAIRSAQVASLERRMRSAIHGATYLDRCHGVPSPGLSRCDVNAFMSEAEGRQSMSYTSNARIISKQAPEDFVPDGNLDKAVWKTADWVHVDHDMTGTKAYPKSMTDIATVWTPHYIYFAYRCKYTELNIYKDADPAAEKWGLWDRDVVEAFINPQPERVNHYYEFEVSPNNLWIDLEINKDQSPFNDASWDSHYDHATRIDPQHHIWTCEFRIPVASMGAKEIVAGTEWRVNMFRCDGHGEDHQRRFMSWSTIPGGGSFHAPTRFGIVQFVK
jgi:hypothetical protein